MGKRYNYILNSTQALQRLGGPGQRENIYNINYEQLNMRKKYKVTFSFYSRNNNYVNTAPENITISIDIDFGSNTYQYSGTSTALTNYQSSLISGTLKCFNVTTNTIKFITHANENGSFLINCPMSKQIRIHLKNRITTTMPFTVRDYILYLSLEEVDE
jgi:hypothetical protein